MIICSITNFCKYIKRFCSNNSISTCLYALYSEKSFISLKLCPKKISFFLEIYFLLAYTVWKVGKMPLHLWPWKWVKFCREKKRKQMLINENKHYRASQCLRNISFTSAIFLSVPYKTYINPYKSILCLTWKNKSHFSDRALCIALRTKNQELEKWQAIPCKTR